MLKDRAFDAILGAPSQPLLVRLQGCKRFAVVGQASNQAALDVLFAMASQSGRDTVVSGHLDGEIIDSSPPGRPAIAIDHVEGVHKVKGAARNAALASPRPLSSPGP